MAISVADNFSYQGGKPLDARMKYDSVANMVNVPAANLYDGCFAYVTAEQKYYSYDSANDTDPTLGKWREYSGGGGDVDPMPAEDMDDILTPLPGVMARSIYNSRFNRSDMYDTNEVLIGKWIDGKPLYQKVYTGLNTFGSSNAWTSITGITLDGVNQIIKGWGIRTSDGAETYDVMLRVSGSNLQYYTVNSLQSVDVVVIQYTKTGDGTTKVDFDTDYSTDETIVGRWIDGKPLYQKTYSVTSPSSSGNANIADMPANYSYATIINWDITLSDSIQGDFKNENSIQVWIRTNNESGMNKIAMHLENDQDYFNKPVHITLRYTKTTD